MIESTYFKNVLNKMVEFYSPKWSKYPGYWSFRTDCTWEPGYILISEDDDMYVENTQIDNGNKILVGKFALIHLINKIGLKDFMKVTSRWLVSNCLDTK